MNEIIAQNALKLENIPYKKHLTMLHGVNENPKNLDCIGLILTSLMLSKIDISKLSKLINIELYKDCKKLNFIENLEHFKLRKNVNNCDIGDILMFSENNRIHFGILTSKKDNIFYITHALARNRKVVTSIFDNHLKKNLIYILYYFQFNIDINCEKHRTRQNK